MGDTGPCGPCSEIFYDHGDHISGGPPGSPDEDGDRFVEIWNLVFMQYEQVDAETRLNLPRPSIDTGMGLERVAAVLQGVHDNYDTDTFKALIAASGELTRSDTAGPMKASHRVIADHLRASGFLVADGVLPANEGRGYVLRRIMRRAMRHAHLLGAAEPLMHRLVPSLVAEMGAAYPELVRAQPLIEETLKLEETRFRQTLDKGLKLLDEATAGMGEGATLPGDVAFKLYDTYGFPYDLTEDALRATGHAGRSRRLRCGDGGAEGAPPAPPGRARAKRPPTRCGSISPRNSAAPNSPATRPTDGEGRVVAIVRDGQRVKAAQTGDEVFILTNQTPFYARERRTGRRCRCDHRRGRVRGRG